VRRYELILFCWSTEDLHVLQTTITDHPTTLSANGETDLFSVCSSTLYYNRRPTVVAPDCQNVALYINAVPLTPKVPLGNPN
jgi:hypothetical protein